MTIHLNWQQFVDKYSPIKNTIELDTPCDGFLFLDKDQIKDVPLERTWSLMNNEVDDDIYITNGIKIINSMGYLVTREFWTIDEVIEVRLEEGYEIK